jgi:hypothetical protein
VSGWHGFSIIEIGCVEMYVRVKKCILMILSILLLCSCAGTGHKGIVNVPGQDVSFISPQSDWETTLFTSTSKVPSGGFLPIKFFRGSWSKNNLSTIGITGVNISGIKKEGATRAGLISALESEVLEFKKVCGFVSYNIKNESNGTLREGIDFTELEADIKCVLSGSDDPLKARTILYVLESMDYLYTLQFKAVEKYYDQDISAFEQILDSIIFTAD